jgi:hypothetical protein
MGQIMIPGLELDGDIMGLQLLKLLRFGVEISRQGVHLMVSGLELDVVNPAVRPRFEILRL